MPQFASRSSHTSRTAARPFFSPARGGRKSQNAAPATIQRKDSSSPGGTSSSHQTAKDGTSHAPPIVHDVLKSSGEPLDAGTRSFMEPRFGRQFGNVRLHAHAQAAASADAIGARAYNAGNHIVFAAGAYQPGTSAGRALIAHELAHVVQHSPTSEAEGVVMRKPAKDPHQVESSDRAAKWWNPLGNRISVFGVGAAVSHVNVLKGTLAENTGAWRRNALDAALFAVGVTVLTEVVSKRLKLDALTRISGYGAAFAVAYKGLDTRERIRCKTVDTYPWYGRYRYNPFSENLFAVEYWGKGPTEKVMVKPVYYDQAIVNADGNPLFVYTTELPLGLDLSQSAAFLPLFSYGDVDGSD